MSDPVYVEWFVQHVRKTNGTTTVHWEAESQLSQEMGLLSTKSESLRDGARVRLEVYEDDKQA